MNNTTPSITTSDFLTKIHDSNCQFVDIRDSNTYNGWRLHDEPRSGHIPGAISFPYSWLQYLDWPEILEGKKLDPEKEVIIYGSNPDEIANVSEQFSRVGFVNINWYTKFTDEWLTDPSNPLDSLHRFRQLVPASWLKQLLDTGKADEYSNNKFVLCHAHYQNREAYDRGHIPCAIELDTNRLESEKTWNRRSSEEIRNTLLEHGITSDTTVILYGRFDYPTMDNPFPGSSAGHLGAMRCAFLLLYAGVTDVRILNGGLRAWEDNGYPISTEETIKQAVPDFGVAIPQNPRLAVDTPEAKVILAQTDANLVSVRSWREFIGEVSGYHYIEPKGRIPGAVFGNCGTDAYHMENYRNPDHTTLAYPEIARQWADVGITADTFNAFYCGTGWRGSEAFINAWLMGWPRIAVYDGGWYEWSGDPNNPIETGIPE